MFIDSSRQHDLQRIDRMTKDLSVPLYLRRKAYASKKQILKQLHDKKLVRMRERLIAAGRVNDKWEMYKITNQIKDYLHEERFYLHEEGLDR